LLIVFRLCETCHSWLVDSYEYEDEDLQRSKIKLLNILEEYHLRKFENNNKNNNNNNNNNNTKPKR
jgi:hypothetical protein